MARRGRNDLNRGSRMKTKRIFGFRFVKTGIAAAMMLSPLFAPAIADSDEENSRRRGAELAVALCSNCHIVAEDQRGAVPDGIPPFETIANRPGRTVGWLRVWLLDAHPPMPQVPLSETNTRDIIAYLRSFAD